MLKSFIESMITELTRIQSDIGPQRRSTGGFSIPPMLGTGREHGIIISEKIEDDIRSVANQMSLEKPMLGKRFKQKEWKQSVRRAFGPALAAIDLDNDLYENAELVLREISATLEGLTTEAVPREHVFGCTLFGHFDERPFRIGPVLFEPRIEWLERMVASGVISAASYRRLKRQWLKNTSTLRKPNWTPLPNDLEITSALDAAPYICTVSTMGLAPEAGTEKAATAARMALTAIALLWQTPTKVLCGFRLNNDRQSKHNFALTFLENGVVHWSASLVGMPHGPTLETGEWARVFQTKSAHFRVIGECLDFLICADASSPRPNLMKALSMALLWFHKGCIEESATMGVVQFAASMDALAMGGKSNGILRLINARLGMVNDKPIRRSGPTLKHSIQRIFNEGRSRHLHGNPDAFGHDWSDTRDLAEQFARLCLVSCIDWIAKSSTSDDVQRMQS